MIQTIRSEIRKILTLRSTYVILGLNVLLVLIMDGWATGYKHAQLDARFVSGVVTSTLQGTSFMLGLIVLLQITQEYRHNTIYYTLTLARRRTTVFLAKAIVASVFMLLGAAMLAAVGVLSAIVGVAASGASLGAQSVPWAETLLRGSVYVWAAGMFALSIGFVMRNQVGVIVTYLFGISLAEQLLSLLLKTNSGYLPFRALEGVIAAGGSLPSTVFGHEKSMVIVLAWLGTAGGTAWLLFVRRDAN